MEGKVVSTNGEPNFRPGVWNLLAWVALTGAHGAASSFGATGAPTAPAGSSVPAASRVRATGEGAGASGANEPSGFRPERPDDPPMERALPPGVPTVSVPRDVTVGPYHSVQVNIDAGGNNLVGDAANEPSIAVDASNPSRIVIGWRQFDTVASNFRQAGRGYSHDGGRTWTFPGVFEPGVFRSDPVLGADAEGTIYYNSLRVDGSQYDCDFFKSDDGGVTWTEPLFAQGGDKLWFTISRTGGLGHGHIYQAWNVAGNQYFPATFNRSVSGGVFWSVPQELPGRPVFGSLAVGPSGELYVAGVPNSSNTAVSRVTKSVDAQNPFLNPTFSPAVQVNLDGRFRIGRPPNPGGLMGMVWIDVDRSGGARNGWVYLLASAERTSGDPMDIMFSRSTDGGQTWSAAVRINDDDALGLAWQWFGTLSVAPNGRIDAIWNDTRDSGVDTISALYYSSSEDGGVTWSANVRLSPSFDSTVGWPDQNKIGDYYHMVSDNVGANLAYSATFNDEQDVYFLRIGPRLGDDDGDDDLDLRDYGKLQECYLVSPLPAGGERFDFNSDGVVGTIDYRAFHSAFTGPG